MMPKQLQSIRELLEYIVRTQTEIVRVLGDDDFPVLAPPASAGAIARTEGHVGLTFPPSYREFLEESNGVRHFANEIDLVSVEDMRSREYESLTEEVRTIGWKIGERILVEGLIIAGRPGYRSVFLIDSTVEPDGHREHPVVHWSDTVLLRAASFREFLQQWCDVVDELLIDSRQKARETPRGIPIPRRPRPG